MAQISGYHVVKELLRDEQQAVYRGRRHGSRQPVLLRAPARPIEAGAQQALEQEAELLKLLQVAGVPRPYGIVQSDAGPCLVLQDRGLEPLSGRSSSGTLDLEVFFKVAVGLCDLLAEIHRRGVTVGGINPTSVFASAAGDDVQIVNFSAASRSSSGVLPAAGGRRAAYVSPEQTGRINRTADYRSDFYSLGATLYELLTGAPPFASEDPLELIHAHLARAAVPPSQVRRDVPDPVSRILLKLLAKEAEDRYRSAMGIRHDFEVCARRWSSSGAVADFVVGEHDVSDRFVIPRRLYGREREVAELTAAFQRTCAGQTSLFLVSGYSGIGKTSLIRELYRPIVRQRAYFISGKFDPVVRSVPYGAIAQAFNGLVRQLLTESESRLASWRERISDALGANGGVLAELLPDIELVIGRQPPAPPLEAVEAQNRFQYVLQNFVQTFARADHPLVLFLDDVQWVDAATLDLLYALVTSPDIDHLLIVGAYRENEVQAGHPLTRVVSQVEAAGAEVRRLALGSLALPDLVSFLSDILHGPEDAVRPLAELIQQKTDGNPFFVIQFLHALEQEGFFEFDQERVRWTFRLDDISRAATTDNVVDLMTRKIQWLSAEAQLALTLASCMGNRFSAATLRTVSRQPGETAMAGLVEACQAGLIEELGERVGGSDDDADTGLTYGFVHDQVQQAAYGLIPEAERRQVHLDVGRLLLADCGGAAPDDRLFEIAGHLNIGRDLITQAAERRGLAELNLAAGRKAKASAAYPAACEYLDAGLAAVGADRWASDYELVFALSVEAAECRYLARLFDRAERELYDLLSRAATVPDRVLIHTLRVMLYEHQSRWQEAVACGRDGLALFGIALPEGSADTKAALDREVVDVDRALGARSIPSLSELPAMRDPNVRGTMRLLTVLWAPAYISGDQLLARLLSATMVRLSLTHGNTEDSAYGFVTHALTVGPARGDYKSAYAWGELALRVNDQFADVKRRAKIHQQFQAHVNLWCRPLETCIPHAREACRSGLETGDFTYAGYGAATEAWAAFLVARDLDRFVRDYTPHLDLLTRLRMTDFRAAHRVLLNWALALQGRTLGRLSLSDESFDEAAFVAKYESAPFFLAFLHIARLHLGVLLDECDMALDAAARARESSPQGIIWPVVVDFWSGLATARVAERASSEDDRRAGLARLDAIVASFSALADQCPENFRCGWLLLSAERARVNGRAADAARLAEDAVGYARALGLRQYEALASELCARAWLGAGKVEVATPFLRDAHRLYGEWGAVIKVEQLEARHAGLLDRRPAGAPAQSPIGRTPNTSSGSRALDTVTALKVAHAVARELELDGLLRSLIHLAVENAGAERGAFIRHHDGQLTVEAESGAIDGPIAVRPGVPVDQAGRLPLRVIRYVQRTRQDVVVQDASVDDRFAGDEYIDADRVRSILCVPVEHQGRLGGILYLENNLTTGAFTPERVEVMRILAAQAAISLENARLYEGLRTEVGRRTDAEQALRGAMSDLEQMKNRLEAENVYLQEEIRTQHNFDEIVGNSPALLDALRRVERVAPTEASVLILGETGSGKELFARAVHRRSARRQRPLVKVNCGAIAPGLVESELFGHAKGAFTGALDKRVGRFELADGGTIFLDEVGELPLDAQVKLLRVLQEHEFEPVGSSRTVRVDIRVIAATNRDLDAAVAEGRFRADLFYRLNVFPVTVPPLRERVDDIPRLVGFLVAALARRLGKPLQGFSANSMRHMQRYPWPGNVRELQNVVERAAILASGSVLEVEPGLLGLPATAPLSSSAAAPVTPGAPGDAGAPAALGTLDDAQRAHIQAALHATAGVIEGAQGAATLLGLHPNTLRSRMKKLGVAPISGARRPSA